MPELDKVKIRCQGWLDSLPERAEKAKSRTNAEQIRCLKGRQRKSEDTNPGATKRDSAEGRKGPLGHYTTERGIMALGLVRLWPHPEG